MGSVATILLFGRLYQTIDIKRLFLSSIVIFEVGSALCGAAPCASLLIVGRATAGIGGCGMYIGYVDYLHAS